MNNVEATIEQVENLFKKVTGQPAPQMSQPYAPLDTTRDPAIQIQRNMETLLHSMQDPQLLPQVQVWQPQLAMWENETEFVIRLDIPAVLKEDIDLTVEGNVLNVRGVRRSLDQNQNFRPLWVENIVGPFQRSIELPPFVNTSKVDSRVTDGVLEITLPKTLSASTGRLEVARNKIILKKKII